MKPENACNYQTGRCNHEYRSLQGRKGLALEADKGKRKTHFHMHPKQHRREPSFDPDQTDARMNLNHEVQEKPAVHLLA